MRARNLKPALFKNELLAVADPLYTLIFAGLWCLADREGRLEDRPARIHFDINPGRPFDSTSRALDWLENKGFLQRYQVGELRIIWIVQFAKHQDPHHKEGPSKLPKPKASLGQARGEPGVSLELAPLTPDSGFLTPDSITPPTSPSAVGVNGSHNAVKTPPAPSQSRGGEDRLKKPRHGKRAKRLEKLGGMIATIGRKP